MWWWGLGRKINLNIKIRSRNPHNLHEAAPKPVGESTSKE
jgi:hypothetical protein